jgi:hypothetical protein
MRGFVQRHLVAVTIAFCVFLFARAAAAADLPDVGTEPAPAAAWHPYVSTAIGELGALVTQGAWYWAHMQSSPDNVPFTWSTWETKLFSDRYLVLDDDRFLTGGLGHPLAGTVYYQIARGNGLGIAESFLVTVASSFAWQYFAEFNSKPASNDLLVTPVAGWAIGEATFRLGRLFAAGEPTLANCVGAVLFSPVAAFHEPRVCEHWPGDPPFDGWGLPRRTWHRLDLELGAARSAIEAAAAPSSELSIRLNAEVVTNAAYNRPGAGTSTFGPGQWTSVGTRWLLDDGAVRGVSFHADALLVGRYTRRFGDRDAVFRRADGRGLLLGLESTFDYEDRALPIALDRTATIGVAGPVAEIAARRGPIGVRARLAITYAFGQITSLAYAQARGAFVDVSIKSELEQHGYYYGQGFATYGLFELDLGDLRLSAAGTGASYWSLDFDDTNQSKIQDNFSLHDVRVFLRTIAAVRPLGGPLRLALEADRDIRRSWIPAVSVSSEERRLLGSAALEF